MAKKKAKTGRPKAAKKKMTKKTARTAKRTKKIVKKKTAAKKKPAKKPVKKATRKVVKKAPRKVARQTLKKRAPRAAPPAKAAMPPMPVFRAPVAAPPPPPPPPVVPAPAGESQPGGYGPVVDVSTPAPLEESSSDEPYPRLEVGTAAPELELRDQSGQTHTLARYRGQKVVLYFYPQDDTPGCTVESCAFRDALGAFSDRNTVVLGISTDSAVSHQRFAQKYSLPFPLLADEGHQVAQRYGVWVRKSPGGALGIARTTFVIDASGFIAHIFRGVKPDGHPQEVLARLPF